MEKVTLANFRRNERKDFSNTSSTKSFMMNVFCVRYSSVLITEL